MNVGDQYTTIERLATLNSQDQVGLGYMPLYASLFEPIRFDALAILEIGFSRGRGARTLAEFFHHSQVHTLDHELHIVQPYYDAYPDSLKERIHLYPCDQGKQEDLDAIVAKLRKIQFNLIIDDGSHNPVHQLLSFTTLWKKLASGGYYIIEDMHPSYVKGRHPTVDYFTALVNQINKEGDVKNPNHPDSDIEWVMFPCNRVVVRKR